MSKRLKWWVYLSMVMMIKEMLFKVKRKWYKKYTRLNLLPLKKFRAFLNFSFLFILFLISVIYIIHQDMVNTPKQNLKTVLYRFCVSNGKDFYRIKQQDLLNTLLWKMNILINSYLKYCNVCIIWITPFFHSEVYLCHFWKLVSIYYE